MENKPKRPLIIWLIQGVLALTAVWSVTLIFFATIYSTSEIVRTYFFDLSLVAVFFVCLPLLACWALGFRKTYGRFLAWISLFCLCIFFVQKFVLSLQNLLGYVVAPYQPNRLIALAISVVIILFLLVLMFNLTFNKRVSNFYAPERQELDDNLSPPPPPSFDA